MQDEGRRQTWLAARIGKHESEVSRYINRGLIPDEDTRQAIADALGRQPSELWPDLYEPKAVA
jgi:lambda repressor-like predicted transcriptional regulator